ncbi:hypothetical protein C1645_767158 [Glomus cerebriforme]|uniref:ATP-grasp domain-containing protein n=1 Tax=Glomus cerebriforme TaxID=658196 RepID=A0A397T052_9GLOM|nr:hypothetical protein C1645_767158 [Glomus cerebriforme]
MLKNLSNIYKYRRATRPYAPYMPINYNVNYVSRCEISTGIRLNNDYNYYGGRKDDNDSVSSSEFTPTAILYQALQPPVIDGIRKPMKPGGYSDSGADIGYALKSNSIPIITPVDKPRPTINMDWVFPDTEEGINAALAKGAKTLWANTILFDVHPLNYMKLGEDIKLVGHPPSKVQKFDNKWIANELMRSRGLLVPHAILIGNTTHNGAYELNSLTLDTLYKNNIRLPAVVKPIRGRGSQGVKKVNTMEQLKEHAKNLLTSGAVIDGQRYSEYGDPLILEQYLEGEEITVTVMPPGKYDINFKSINLDKYWHLPIVKRFNHHDGIAPYSGVVAVMENSTLLNDEEIKDPTYQQVARDCEQAAQIIKPLAPIRLDCRRIASGKQFALFDLNMKPNMTGPGRPGRNMHSSLSCISACGIGWTYPDLLRAMLRQDWPIKNLSKRFNMAGAICNI